MNASFLIPILITFAVGSARADALKGEPSLQGATAQTDGYLNATPSAADPLNQRLEIWLTSRGSQIPIRQYQDEMTKKLHVIIVSGDFKTFLHIHPNLAPNGHFLITQHFPAAGTYFVYADAMPGELNQQVFRFKLDVGHASSAARKLPHTGTAVQTGPYEVTLSTVHIHSGRTEMVDVKITENGKPAHDLRPYLGEPAHAVFLNAKDLSYVHVHPMSMGGMSMSNGPPAVSGAVSVSGKMMLHFALREAGTYRMWLQFRGANDRLYIAEFTILAS